MPAGAPLDAAGLLHGGRVVITSAKHHLPNYGVFDEFRYFVPGNTLPVFRLATESGESVEIATAICEDLWQDGGPVAVCLRAGAGLLAHQIGQKRAREVWFLCRQYDAQTALDWGLVNRVAPAGALDAAVEETAVALAAGSGSAARTVKALVNRAFDADLAGGLELELSLVAAHMRTAEAAEGLRAFAEKRKPVFHAP